MTTAHQLAEQIKTAFAEYQVIIKATAHNTEEQQHQFEAEIMALLLDCYVKKAEAFKQGALQDA